MAKEKGTDYREILFFLSDKEKDYIRYINEHIANVKNVWKRVRLVNYPNGTEDTLVRLVNKAIEEHDSSKYVGNEFTGYRQWFYPEEGSKKDQKLFEKVWNEHQKANSYHWQYHLLFQPDMTIKALYMATVDVLEMLADWSAMSIKFDNIPSEWYEKNKDNMLLHPSTKNMIETFLPMFDEAIDLIQRGVDEPEEVKPEELVKKKRKPRAKKTETVESEEETVAEKEKPKKKAPAKKKAVAKKKEK